ncbi:MAG: dipicolinate synthase subunit DpsA [Clostridia bacterium]|nr:dipicolinate synthase subunit DpsA [Clostridia bacterium]
MKFLIIGGDMRNVEVANILSKNGHICHIYGLEKAEGIYENVIKADAISAAIKGCDGVILPVPVSKDGIKIIAPFSDDDIYLAEVFCAADKNTSVFGGMVSKNLMEIASLRGIKIYDYMDDEKVKIKNAELTAEGALEIAINRTKHSIFGSNILVCGYGRIGKFIAKYLKALGGNVTVTSRNDDTLTEGLLHGYSAINTKKIHTGIEKYNLIINTVPTLIFDEMILKKCKNDVKIIDLASAPGGVDFEKAKTLGVDVIHALSLPGKTAPKTAAKIITNSILEKLNKE